MAGNLIKIAPTREQPARRLDPTPKVEPADMTILWRYLRPLRWWVALDLALAGIAQILDLVDPMILGKIIDEYA